MSTGRLQRWAWVLAASACLSCGGAAGVSTDPLEANFPLGPVSVRRAVAARFSDRIAPDAETWPADAPALTTDVTVQTDASVDVKARQAAGKGKAMSLEGASL